MLKKILPYCLTIIFSSINYTYSSSQKLNLANQSSAMLAFTFHTISTCPLSDQSKYYAFASREILSLADVKAANGSNTPKCVSNWGYPEYNINSSRETTYCFKLEVDRANAYSSDWHIHGLWPQWDQFCAFNMGLPGKLEANSYTDEFFAIDDYGDYYFDEQTRLEIRKDLQSLVDRDINSTAKSTCSNGSCCIQNYFTNYIGDKQSLVNQLKEKMSYNRGYEKYDYVKSMVFWEKEYVKHGTCVQEFLNDKFFYFEKALELFNGLKSRDFSSCTLKKCGFCFDADFNRMVCA